MSFNFLSGTQGFVKIGGTAYSFGKWRLPIQTGLPKMNNFNSAFQILVAGLTKATLYIEGPYDAGNMPFSSGTLYTWVLGWSVSLSISVPAYIGELVPDNNVEDAPRVQITAESSGSFTPSIT